MRLPVTSALNSKMIGWVRLPLECRWGCNGPVIVALEKVWMSWMREYYCARISIEAESLTSEDTHVTDFLRECIQRHFYRKLMTLVVNRRVVIVSILRHISRV